MTPLERYQHDLLRDDFLPDASQEAAVRHLQSLHDALLAAEAVNRSWSARLRRRLARGPMEPVRGLYFWGGVGRGKTYLVDIFYECLPFERKTRMHFHRFMQWVHHELDCLKGRPDPLLSVGERLAAQARVLCFDEFHVADIADAMVLGGLMQALFANGVTLVATSNIVPDELYRNGLQRQRFMPAIELIKRHTRVVNVDGGVDYRLRTLEQAEIYHWPLDAAAESSLCESFLKLAPEPGMEGEILQIEGRTLPTRSCADDVAWFDFTTLCDGPRSQNDYIELARQFHAVLVSGVPVMDDEQADQARRFISLVDEFYDRNVKLILSAAAPVETLYRGERLRFEFERTRSRLLEMQSHDYLARPHRA